MPLYMLKNKVSGKLVPEGGIDKDISMVEPMGQYNECYEAVEVNVTEKKKLGTK